MALAAVPTGEQATGLAVASPTKIYSSNEEQWRQARRKYFSKSDANAELRRACREMDLQLLQESLRRGASVHSFDEAFERRALHHAALAGDKRVADQLLTVGAAIEAADQCQMTALHLAAERGHADFLALLIKRGASVNPRASNGTVALHLACHNKHLEAARTLVQAAVEQGMVVKGPRAYDAFRDYSGLTPVGIAESRGHRQLVDLLEKAVARREFPTQQPPKPSFPKRPDGIVIQDFYAKVGLSENAKGNKVLKFGSLKLTDGDLHTLSYVSLHKGRFQELRDLDLSGNLIGDAGVSELAQVAGLGALRTLEVINLARNAIGDEAMRALARAFSGDARTLAACRTLDLSDNYLTDASMRDITGACGNSGALKRLRTLRLNTNHFSDDVLASLSAVRSSGGMNELREIELSNNQVGDEPIRKGLLAPLLIKAKPGDRAKDHRISLLATLETLKLNNNGITNAGLSAFSEACKRTGHPLQLKTLWMGCNEIADLGVYALVAACQEGALPKLESLLLYSNDLSDGTMHSLASASKQGAFPQLRCICLQGAKLVTKGGRDAVRQALAVQASPRGTGKGLHSGVSTFI